MENDYIAQVSPVISKKVIGLCKHPYHNHPKGCPNFGKKEGCPPNVKLFNEVYDLTYPVYVIYNSFDLYSHVKRIKQAHPKWTKRQLYSSRYWQGSARKQLRIKIEEFLERHPSYHVTTCPEAMGVNVTETMKQVDVILQWPPTDTSFQIALAGIRLDLL